MKNIFNYYILSLIILSAFFVRLYKVRNPVADWHSWRQVDTASVTLNYVDKGIQVLYPKYHDISSIQTGFYNPEGYRFVEFPIFNVFHFYLYKFIPFIEFDTAGRLVSIISALITALCLYYLGNYMGGKWTGLLATFFYSFIPFNIYFTRVILPDPLSTMFAVISLSLMIHSIESDKRIYLYLSAIFFSLALLVKPYSIFYAVPMGLIYIRRYGLIPTLKNKHIWVSLAIAFSPVFLWRAWMSQFVVGIPYTRWAFNGDKIRFRPSYWKWIYGERLGKLILGMWGLAPFVFGLIRKQKNSLLMVMTLGMFLYLSIVATANVRHDYYQTFILPTVSLALAYGVDGIWKMKANRFISRPIIILSVFLTILIGLYEVRENYKINHSQIIAAGKKADELLPSDALVIAPYNGNTAFLYQTKRWGWPVVDESIEGMISKGADFYISVNKGDNDTQNFKKKYKILYEEADFIILDLKSPIKV